MTDYSNTQQVAELARQLLESSPDDPRVVEAHKRASTSGQSGQPKTALSELCWLLWQGAGMPLHPAVQPEMISAAQAEELSGLSRPMITHLCREGIVKATKIAGAWLIEKESLLLYVQRDHTAT